MKKGNLLKLVGNVFIVATTLTACKKETVELDNQKPGIPTTPLISNAVLLDSALLYTKDLYLWYNQIPSNFSNSSFSDPEKLMAAIQQYSNEAGFSKPVDRWSFAMKQSEWDNISSGIAGDFGMGVSYYQSEDNLRVTYVEKASPAGKAGIRRGWKITKINGNTNISYANKDVVSNAVFNSSNTSFTFTKPDNSTVNLTLHASTYLENPIYLDTIYTSGTQKIGYLVFNSFLGDTTQIYQQFNAIFNRFANQKISDLVVDLRYNGGGYVSMQEKLANYLVKPSANGSVMMKQTFNDKLSAYNETMTFHKLGSLSLDRIFFIVSNNTASASELLINSLKPFMDVKLVGPSNTHGKPVGFFPYPVQDWYIFPVSFRTVNKNGEGSYFEGMATTSKASDGIDKDRGDSSEPCLATTMKYIVGGSFRIQTDTFNENPVLDKANETFTIHSFKGAIDTRKLK